MHKPGDVILFWNDGASKQKYHLCISLNGKYLFLNSPKKKQYEGDLILPCSDFPFLEPTEAGSSIVCCTLIVAPTDDELKGRKALYKGTADRAVLLKIIGFVEESDVIADDERDAILDGLGDWL